VLTAVAAFAEVLTHPAALGLVFALALLVADARRLRLAAAAVGVVMALPAALLEDHGAVLPGLAAIAGGAAGALLQAEVMLHLVLPAGRFAWGLARAAGRLAAAAAAFLMAPGPGVPPSAPPRRDTPGLPPIEPEP
jgi:hypothetical protein